LQKDGGIFSPVVWLEADPTHQWLSGLTSVIPADVSPDIHSNDISVISLFIDTGSQSANDCDCEDVIYSSMSSIADILTGQDGSLCERWVELDLSQPRKKIWNPSSLFLYPTPRLRSLKLFGVSMKTIGWERGKFLPFMPSLETVIIDHCILSGLPDISNAKYVTINHLDSPSGLYSPDMRYLRNATQAQRLELDIPPQVEEYRLPNMLPFLTTLHLGLENPPVNIEEVSIPNIRNLSLAFNYFVFDAKRPHFLWTLLECPKIPLDQVQVLRINTYEKDYPLIFDFEFRDTYYVLLLACCNVKELHADKFSAPLILKLLRDGIDNQVANEADGDDKFDGIYDHSIYLSDGFHHGKEVRPGREERTADIDTMSREIGWMDIQIPWEKMRGKFYGPI
jgi:hypothetical protein